MSGKRSACFKATAYGGCAKGTPRNEVDVPSVNPITVASSSRTIGGPVEDEAAIAARHREHASDAILLSMTLT